LNLAQNRVPEKVKTIHLIAICGAGMSALAGMLKEAGFKVTGSDGDIHPPMSTFLAQHGIEVAKGFRPENLSHRPDLVVVGNAVSRDNPEVSAMLDNGIPFCSLPQALNRFFIHGKGALLVTGTHGRTTTSALLAWVLATAGLDPGFMVGGILKNLDRNYNLGTGPYFVVEGDEYETAFFDKQPKFLHYTPSRAILTSVEFDHADIYRDLGQVKSAFARFVSALPPEALLIACNTDQNAGEIASRAPCWTVTCGMDEKLPWAVKNAHFDAPWTYFEVTKRGKSLGTFRTRLMGRHNLLNTLAVIAMADDLRIPVDIISRGLETFEGIKRHQEIRGIKRDIIVMDDLAHHPAEVRETISAVRFSYPDKRIVVVFEPRTNSSRRKVFQDIYPDSFGKADIVCIRKPPMLDKIPPGDRFSSKELARELRARGKQARYFPDTEAIIEYIAEIVRPNDVILIMSSGGFDNIHERLLNRL